MCISRQYNTNLRKYINIALSDPCINIISMEWSLSLLEFYNIYVLFRESCYIFQYSLQTFNMVVSDTKWAEKAQSVYPSLQAERAGNQIPVGSKFSAPV